MSFRWPNASREVAHERMGPTYPTSFICILAVAINNMNEELVSSRLVSGEHFPSLELYKERYKSLERDLNKAKTEPECHFLGWLVLTQESNWNWCGNSRNKKPEKRNVWSDCHFLLPRCFPPLCHEFCRGPYHLIVICSLQRRALQ